MNRSRYHPHRRRREQPERSAGLALRRWSDARRRASARRDRHRLRRARAHPGLQAEREFEVVGIVSHARAAPREVAERVAHAATLTDHRDLLALPGLDAVSVASTPDRHPEHVEQRLAVGLHVLCEKPLARNLDEGAAMPRVGRGAAGVVTIVDHGNRWQPERHASRSGSTRVVGTP